MKATHEENPLKETLRKSGFKATPARLAILEIFKRSKNPLSAQEIVESLPSDSDQATVYRTLAALKEKGLIHQINLRHNHAHYELTDTEDHHHLVCLRCGKIEDVYKCGVEEIQAGILRTSKHFEEIRQHTLEFYGICKSCAKKSIKTTIIADKNAPL